MAVKAYKERIFEAKIIIGSDDDIEERICKFRHPRPIDYHNDDGGNSTLNLLYTFSNIAKPFDKPVQVSCDDGSLLNVDHLRGLINLGVPVDISEAIMKWYDEKKAAEAEKERLAKKSKSAGNSTEKGSAKIEE